MWGKTVGKGVHDMNGTWVGAGIVGFAAVFGAGLYYAQTFAYYEEVTALEAVETSAGALPVSGYVGIDAATSPMKLRGCFTADPAAVSALPPAPQATPLVAPAWFECFDAKTLSDDLAAARARVHLAADETPEGAGYSLERYIAIYPDGRAFMWRQLIE